MARNTANLLVKLSTDLPLFKLQRIYNESERIFSPVFSGNDYLGRNISSCVSVCSNNGKWFVGHLIIVSLFQLLEVKREL